MANEMTFNLDDFNFEELASDIFGDDVTTAKLNPDLQGKVILVYGAKVGVRIDNLCQ